MRISPVNKSRFLSISYAIAMSAAMSAMVAGCSDDTGDQPDAAPADAAPDIDAGGPQATAFLVASDFLSGTGIASTIDVPALDVNQNAIAGVASGDSVVRHIGDTLYVINRFGFDNITRLDATALTLIDQVSTGAGSNPQDVAVVGDKLYVAALGTSGIVTIDGQGNLGSIDLSALDANDGLPDCNSLYLVDDMLVVTCGLLENFVPVGFGRVAIIDTADDTLVTDFPLSTANPIGGLHRTAIDGQLGGDLLVPTVTFGADLLTGCLERISVNPTFASAGCLIDNATLGGYATGVAEVDGDRTLLAVTSGYDGEGRPIAEAVMYDAATDEIGAEPVSAPDELIFDVTVCPTGHWLFADASGGIRVYDADGVQLTQDVLDIGLPPVGGGMVCY